MTTSRHCDEQAREQDSSALQTQQLTEGNQKIPTKSTSKSMQYS
jgi:hypothetical protein